MPIPKVTEREVEAVLSAKSLSIGAQKQRLKWSGSSEGWLKLEFEVVGAEPHRLRLIVTANTIIRSKYSFALLLNNARVRALDFGGSHTNRHTNSESWRHELHKHRWTDVCFDRFAYTPTDIKATSISEQLIEFCTECGIDFQCEFPELPPVSNPLFDEV